MTVTQRLQEWFRTECNGDWEHQYGVKIQTLDNPGWMVDIDLVDTALERRQFSSLVEERSEDNWIHCKIEGGVFKGRGGPGNLDELLLTFLAWAEP